MPILQISLAENQQQKNQVLNPATRFAELMDINKNLVTVYTHKMENCFGNHYQAVAHLYIPDLWTTQKIHQMEKAVTQILAECWNIATQQTIVMVHTIASGHVTDRGNLESF